MGGHRRTGRPGCWFGWSPRECPRGTPSHAVFSALCCALLCRYCLRPLLGVASRRVTSILVTRPGSSLCGGCCEKGGYGWTRRGTAGLLRLRLGVTSRRIEYGLSSGPVSRRGLCEIEGGWRHQQRSHAHPPLRRVRRKYCACAVPVPRPRVPSPRRCASSSEMHRRIAAGIAWPPICSSLQPSSSTLVPVTSLLFSGVVIVIFRQLTWLPATLGGAPGHFHTLLRVSIYVNVQVAAAVPTTRATAC